MKSHEYIPPMSGEILDIANALARSNARIRRASKDSDMIRIVNEIEMSVHGFKPDYEAIGELLDQIQTRYDMFPIEVVEAYNVCERRQPELIDG